MWAYLKKLQRHVVKVSFGSRPKANEEVDVPPQRPSYLRYIES